MNLKRVKYVKYVKYMFGNLCQKKIKLKSN